MNDKSNADPFLNFYPKNPANPYRYQYREVYYEHHSCDLKAGLKEVLEDSPTTATQERVKNINNKLKADYLLIWTKKEQQIFLLKV